MRFLSLDLLAFGAFTDATIDLSGGSFGLHLIHGRNEAGKSTTLRALRQFLFGIPARSADNFLHAAPNLRIGATIMPAGRDEPLAFVRRKGIKNTLRDKSDRDPVDAGILTGLLEGVDERQFDVLFGLDHDALVKGGEELLSGSGDLGQILFAAGMSTAGVQAALVSLSDESRKLFLPAGQNPRINEALRHLSDLRGQLKARQLSHNEWSKHDRALEDAIKQKEMLEAGLSSMKLELKRLERLLHAGAPVAQRALCLERLEALEKVPPLPADFADRARELLNSRQNAASGLKQAEEAILPLKQKLQDIRVPEELIKHADFIESLFKELGAHQKASEDRIRLSAQLSACEAEAHEILRSLGKSNSLDDCDRLRVTSQNTALLQDLMIKAEAVQTAAQKSTARLAKLRSEVDATRKELEELPHRRSVGVLQTEIKQRQESSVLELQMDQLSEELEALTAEIADRQAALGLESCESSKLASLPVPLSETIERYQKELALADDAVRDNLKRTQELDASLADSQREIDRLELEMDVPTEKALSGDREDRDNLWRLIKRWWLEGNFDDQKISAAARGAHSKDGLAAVYEEKVVLADETADRLRREGQRVGRKAALLAQKNATQAQIDELETARAKLIAGREELTAAWIKLWLPINVTPHPPKEMLAWHVQFAALLESVKRARETRQRQIRVCAQIEGAKQGIVEALKSSGEETPDPGGIRLKELLARADKTLADATELENRRRTLERDLERLLRETGQCKDEEELAGKELREWQRSWGEAVTVLGLTGEARVSEARAVMSRLAELFARLSTRSSIASRIESIDRDAADYLQRVKSLIEVVAPDVTVKQTSLAVEELKARLEGARKLQSECSSTARRLKELEESVVVHNNTLIDCNDLLAVMCMEAKCEYPEELLAVAKQSQEADSLRQRLAEQEEQLARLCQGAYLEQFISEVEHCNSDEISSRMQELSGEISEHEARLQEVHQIIGSERAELGRMNGAGDAAVVAEQIEATLARIGEDTEHYARLRIAEWLLRTAIERYRQKNQSPVLQRASELFAELTDGSFAGLKAEVDESDKSILLGIRSDSTNGVPVSGMSDGTRDQLYLALRIASVENTLAGREPIPFIVDDVLINFDDNRARRALRAFAQLSYTTQVIMFTHHAHLVELARQCLPPSDLFVHELKCASLCSADESPRSSTG